MRTMSEKNHFLAAFRFAGTFVVRLDSSIRIFFFAQVSQSDVFRHPGDDQLICRNISKIKLYLLLKLMLSTVILETLVEPAPPLFEVGLRRYRSVLA